MPRQSPNREDGEAGAEDRDRRIKQVAKFTLMFTLTIFCIAVFGMCFQYFALDDNSQYGIYSLIVGLLAFAILGISIFLYLWVSKPRYRREIRGQYRNFRRAVRRIRLPEFCTRHLRRIHPQPRVMVNTIAVRPQPIPSYEVAGCSVRIETPSPTRPLTPTPPEHSNIGTLSLRNFEDSHGSHPNVLHQD